MNEIRLETQAEIERIAALNSEKRIAAAKLAERLRELKIGNSPSTLQGCYSRFSELYSLTVIEVELDNRFHFTCSFRTQ